MNIKTYRNRKQKLDAKTAECLALETVNREMEERMRIMTAIEETNRQEKEELNNENRKLKETIKVLREEAKEFSQLPVSDISSKKFEDLENKLVFKDQKISELRYEIAAGQTLLEEERRKIAEEKTALENRVNELEKKLGQQAMENSSLMKKIEKDQKEYDELVVENAHYADGQKMLENRIKEFEKLINYQDQRITGLLKESEAAQERYNELFDNNVREAAARDLLESEIEKLEEELEEQKTITGDLEVKNSEKSKEIMELKVQLAEDNVSLLKEQEKIHMLKVQLRIQKIDKEVFEKVEEDNFERMANLQDIFNNVTAEMYLNIWNMEKQIEKLQTANNKLKDSIEIHEHTIYKQKREINNFVKDLEDPDYVNSKILRLVFALRDANKAIEELRNPYRLAHRKREASEGNGPAPTESRKAKKSRKQY